jgi:hypothetical protein
MLGARLRPLPYERINDASTFSCSANLTTATRGASVTLSDTNPSHGDEHSATDIPGRSA